MRLAYLGPYGTFGSEAAIRYDQTAELVPVGRNPEVLRAVLQGKADQGIVPLENSVEGLVTEVVDEFIANGTGLVIISELELPVEQCLIGTANVPLEEVRVVYSHAQALAQCSKFLERNLPSAVKIATNSTAGSVGDALKSSEPAVAIAPARAAEAYPGACVLVRAIQDYKNNTTRFVVVGQCRVAPTGADKTSLCAVPKERDRPGTLYGILGEFAERGINLSKVESRPTKRMLGELVFIIELDGHQDDPIVKEALACVRELSERVTIFGSYPRWSGSAA